VTRLNSSTAASVPQSGGCNVFPKDGTCKPMPRGGSTASGAAGQRSTSPLEEYAHQILVQFLEAQRAVRFFARHGIAVKSLRAAERKRADVARAAAGSASQGLLDPARLVFIDETAVTTNMARPNGRSPRRERLFGGSDRALANADRQQACVRPVSWPDADQGSYERRSIPSVTGRGLSTLPSPLASQPEPPGSCFCPGSARGRRLMGFEEDKVGQSRITRGLCHPKMLPA
jgi:hypothetical protein